MVMGMPVRDSFVHTGDLAKALTYVVHGNPPS
jgi:hypothetical protein